MKSVSMTIQISYRAVLSCDAVYYVVEGGSNFVTSHMKAIEQYIMYVPMLLFIGLFSMIIA